MTSASGRHKTNGTGANHKRSWSTPTPRRACATYRVGSIGRSSKRAAAAATVESRAVDGRVSSNKRSACYDRAAAIATAAAAATTTATPPPLLLLLLLLLLPSYY